MPLAPLHEPHNLAPIKMAMRLNPELQQVACFDTAFHRTAPEVEQAFALPYALFEEAFGATAFMAFPTNISPRCCRSARQKSPMVASWWRISAMAARLVQCVSAPRSQRRWTLRR